MSPTDNTSSTIKMSGFTFMAQTKAKRANIQEKYVFTG